MGCLALIACRFSYNTHTLYRNVHHNVVGLNKIYSYNITVHLKQCNYNQLHNKSNGSHKYSPNNKHTKITDMNFEDKKTNSDNDQIELY